MNLSVLLGSAVRVASNLVTKTVVLGRETLSLLLESLNVTVLGSKLLLQAADLANALGLVELGVLRSVGALQLSVLKLETEDVKDHTVGAVEDQREEEGEATEVHVALGVELASLDLHAFDTANGSSSGCVVSKLYSRQEKWDESLPGTVVGLVGLSKLKLDAVNAVDTVDEQDQDEDKGDLGVRSARKLETSLKSWVVIP